ncbi:MAG: hypothetical protein FWE94_06500 [Coriobacteriia bacterium]|nr:hypothetical protein [Coriobacteriia bacterium]
MKRTARCFFIAVAVLILLGATGCSAGQFLLPCRNSRVIDDSFLGRWCDSRNAKSADAIYDSGIDELEILKITLSAVTFNVRHVGEMPTYRIASNEKPVVGILKNGIASFEFVDAKGNSNKGTIEFLDQQLVVNISAIKIGAEGPGSSLAMSCLMLKDEHWETREIPDILGVMSSFIGLAEDEVLYSKADESSDLPAIKMGPLIEPPPSEQDVSEYVQYVDAGIVGTRTDKVYYKNLHGTIVGSNELEVPLSDSDAVLLFTWVDPGTIRVSKLRGTLPSQLETLLDPPTYWNPGYFEG